MVFRGCFVVSPGQHEVGARVVGAWACWAPLDGVDFFTVGLEVMDTRVLLHTPDLRQTGRSQLLVWFYHKLNQHIQSVICLSQAYFCAYLSH